MSSNYGFAGVSSYTPFPALHTTQVTTHKSASVPEWLDRLVVAAESKVSRKQPQQQAAQAPRRQRRS